MTSSRARRLAPLAFALVLAPLAACGGGDDTSVADRATAAATTEAPATTRERATTTRAEEEDTTTTAVTTAARVTTTTVPVTTTTVAPMLAETTSQQPSEPVGADTAVPVRLRLTSLRRLGGNVVEARLTLVNEGDDGYRPHGVFSGSVLGDTDLRGLALVDLENDRRYLTLLDSNDVCLCSEVGDVTLPAGGTLELYAQFPAPPPEVTAVDVTVPFFPPMNDITIR